MASNHRSIQITIPTVLIYVSYLKRYNFVKLGNTKFYEIQGIPRMVTGNTGDYFLVTSSLLVTDNHYYNKLCCIRNFWKYKLRIRYLKIHRKKHLRFCGHNSPLNPHFGLSVCIIFDWSKENTSERKHYSESEV